MLGPLAIRLPFTLLLAAYLWFEHDVRSPERIALFIMKSCASFVIAMLVAVLTIFIPDILPVTRAGWGPAPGPNQFFYAGAVGGGLLSMAFVSLLPGPASSSRVRLEIGLCAAVAGVLGLVSSLFEDHLALTIRRLPYFAQTMMWQTGMVVTLAVVGDLRTALTNIPITRLSRVLRTFFFVIGGVLMMGATWMVELRISLPPSLSAEQQLMAVTRAAAPSRDDLPPLKETPVADALVPSAGDFVIAGASGVRHEPPETQGVNPGHAARPDRLVFFASYRTPLALEASATIWRYPNRAWAVYEAQHLAGVTERAVGPHRLLASSDEYLWYSDADLVRVTGQSPAVNSLVDAYLAKYPSTIKPGFPLFVNARPGGPITVLR